MKYLKNCIKLSSSVKIYIPTTYDVDGKLCTDSYVDEALEFLSSRFGGATATKALGAWISQEKGLVKEDVVLVFAYAKQDDLEAFIESVYDFCLDIKCRLKQESIALEVNGEMYLI